MKRRLWFLLVLSLAVVGAAVVSGAATGRTAAQRVDVNTKHASELVERGVLPVERLPQTAAVKPSSKASGSALKAAAAADPPLNTVRIMPVLDDAVGAYRFREFTLRGLGQHIEVWVQTGTVAGISGLDYPRRRLPQ